MKFIVDEMPIVPSECPFFANGTCEADHHFKCDYFRNDYTKYDPDARECRRLQESEDTE